MSINEQPAAQQGWVCPKCGAVWAPWQPCCSTCGDNRTTFATGLSTAPAVDWTPMQTTTIEVKPMTRKGAERRDKEGC